jgi:hypothetical protein
MVEYREDSNRNASLEGRISLARWLRSSPFLRVAPDVSSINDAFEACKQTLSNVCSMFSYIC